MPEDASLDAFASPETDDPSEDADAESSTETAEVDSGTSDPDPGLDPDSDPDLDLDPDSDPDPDPDLDPDPARSTYEWSPEGGECADCGASAERRWRRDGQRDGELVCADCKAW